jgi:hypothetical protein
MASTAMTAFIELAHLGLIHPRQLKEIEHSMAQSNIEPQVGKVYRTRRSGMLRTVKVEAIVPPSTYRNTNWQCRDLNTGRLVMMKSKSNFISIVNVEEG